MGAKKNLSKMIPKKILIIFIIIGFVNGEIVRKNEVAYLDIINNLNTLKLLQGLHHLDYKSPCSEHIAEYLEGISSKKLWALTMFDSSAKIPDGLLKGNSRFMGHFDECVEVQHPEQKFQGQHCLLQMELHWTPENNTEKILVGHLMEAKELKLDITGYGICLPSTCFAIEIAAGINHFLAASSLTDTISVQLDKKNCQTKDMPKLVGEDWAAICVFITFGVITVLSSLCDLFQRFYRQNDKLHPLLMSFSIYTNGKYLFQISEGSAQLKCLHGLRVLSICWVVLCHAYLEAMEGPPVNILDARAKLKDANYVVIFNGFVSVDSFFFLSGLLVGFVFFRDISKKGYYDVILGYIHRYIRLTPPYAIMMLFMATVFMKMGNGPAWPSNEPAAEACRKSWWSGLIYVQNFVTPDSACLGQSWYLSTDMQLYWISPFILYPVYYWPKFASIFLGVLTTGATMTAFAIAYINELGPSLLFTPDTEAQGKRDYVNFYTRAAPWLIGLATASIICQIQAKREKVQFSKFWVLSGWIMATTLCLTSLYTILPFTESDYAVLEASFYIAFHRVAWGFGLSWIVLACVTGHGGFVNTFLSWNVFQPLGKLSYNVFLIHASVQLYRIGTVRTSTYIGDLEVTYSFLGDIVLTNLISIPFTLIFEIPFGNMDRYLFRNAKILPFPWPKKNEKRNR